MTPEQAKRYQGSGSGRLSMTPAERREALAASKPEPTRIRKLFGPRPMIVDQQQAIRERPPPNVAQIVLASVCQCWSISRGDLLSRRRVQVMVHPRCAASELLREFTSMSLPEIGKLMRRDHTSIMNQLRRHEVLMQGEDYAGRFEAAKANVMRQIGENGGNN